MQVILLQDVRNLGRRGEIKNVSDGFARNLLFPKKAAEPATPEAVARIEKTKTQESAELNKLKQESQDLAGRLESQMVIIRAKTEKKKLFGSITAREIAQELGRKGFKVNESQVKIDGHLKEIGDFPTRIELLPGIGARITVRIEAA